jgi:microcystin-dependent protein
MTNYFLGQLMLVPFGFAPRGWALCAGQLLAINQNQALFSLLGTNYGGNGVTTFGLPDLRGRAAVSSGNGTGLSPYVLGEVVGVENVALSIAQIPAHQHPFSASTNAANSGVPGGNMLADTTSASLNIYYNTSRMTPGVQMNNVAVGSFGASQPHTNQSPYLVLNWIIALQGIYPSQS